MDIYKRIRALEEKVAKLESKIQQTKSIFSHKKNTSNDELKERVAALVRRRATTKWSEKEVRLFNKVDPQIEDVEYLESCDYANNPYRRRDLYTLLNNWSGEIDRMDAPQIEKEKVENKSKFKTFTGGLHESGPRPEDFDLPDPE